MLTKWVIGLPICSTWSTNYNTVRFLSTLAWFLDVTIFFDAGLIPPVLENVPDNIKAILLDSFTHWSHHPPQQVPYRCLGAHLEEQWYLVAVLMVFLDCLWMIGLFYAQWSYWIRQSQSDKTVFALRRFPLVRRRSTVQLKVDSLQRLACACEIITTAAKGFMSRLTSGKGVEELSVPFSLFLDIIPPLNDSRPPSPSTVGHLARRR